MRIAILAITCLALSCGVLAQGSSAQKRAEDLSRVQELINDPSPHMRVAHFEDIAASGDAVKLQLAVQIALTGNDAILRGVAFRAYIAGAKRIMAEISLSPTLQKALEKASTGDRQAMFQFRSSYDGLERLLSTGMRVDLRIQDFNIASGQGKLTLSAIPNGVWDFNVAGDRLLATIQPFQGVNTPCMVEMRALRDLRISGSMVCQHTSFGPVSLSAPMF
ncbi:hypothetical protein MCEMSEM23_02299 [Rhabdaerophilaceae bacterium]